jgi:hypothetical protein
MQFTSILPESLHLKFEDFEDASYLQKTAYEAPLNQTKLSICSPAYRYLSE